MENETDETGVSAEGDEAAAAVRRLTILITAIDVNFHDGHRNALIATYIETLDQSRVDEGQSYVVEHYLRRASSADRVLGSLFMKEAVDAAEDAGIESGAIDELVGYLRKPDAPYRDVLVRFIGSRAGLRCPKTIAALLGLLENLEREPDLASEAVRVLRTSGPESQAALAKAMSAMMPGPFALVLFWMS